MLRLTRRIFGVASLTLRTAVRSGTAGAVFLLLTILLFALPPLLKGDGTVAGQATVLLTYTLGLVFVTLALATLWGCCSLFSVEISSSRLGLTWVKPITGFQLYAGKFLAVCAINAIALLYASCTIYLMLPDDPASEGGGMRDSVSVVRPVMPSYAEEAKQVYDEMKRSGNLPKGLSRRRIMKTLIRRAPDRYTAIAPGEKLELVFKVPHDIVRDDAPALRVRFETEWNSRQVADARCVVLPGDGAGNYSAEKSFSVSSIRSERNVLLFPLPVQQAVGLKSFKVVLEYGKAGAPDATLLARLRKDVALTRKGASFAGNLIRAALIHLGALAAIAALGLALGAAFSFPVAAFAGSLLLVLFSVSSSIVSSVSDEETDTVLKRVGFSVAEQVDKTISSVVNINALDALVDGEEISTGKIYSALSRSCLLLPLCLGLLSSAALKRRDKQEES